MLRPHTASAEKREYSEGTIFWYQFIKLIYEIINFPLIIPLLNCESSWWGAC